MSAYALPGSFFPPLGGSCASQGNLINVCNSSPLHHFSEEKEKGRIGHFSLESVLSMTTKEAINEKEQREDICPTEVGIAVKRAKIDPVRLVQAVTTTSNNRIDKRSRVNNQDLKETWSRECEREVHEDAIQFELSISFNGRSYCATRSLPCIMELRNDLIRELSSRRKILQSRRLRWSSKTQDIDDKNLVALEDEDDNCDVCIPEIPECDTNNIAVTGGVAGRGFAMLQALLGPYCPEIERWLQNVMSLVPPTTSPSLSNFLWEPVSADIGSRSGMMRSSSSLECIAEDANSEDESKQ